MKVRDLLKMLAKDGWVHVITEGSHRHFKHPTKKGKVTVPGHESDEIAKGTLNRIFKQAGWR